MLAGLPVISGLQMLISFVGHDISRQPDAAIHPRLLGDGRSGTDTPTSARGGAP